MALDSTVKVKFLGDAANLAREAARASRATEAVGKSAETAHGRLVAMAKGFAIGAGVTAAAVGIEKAIRGTVNAYKDAAAETVQLSRVTGQSAQDASRLIFAAKETGVEFDVLARLTGRLEKTLAGADKAQTVLTRTHHLAIQQVPRLVKGHIEYVSVLKNITDVTKHTVAGTQSLGFALRDATGHLLPMSTLLPKIADKFAAMKDGPEKSALALKLFGKEGLALLPLLNQGSAGLAKFADEADKLGITMSTKDVAAYRSFLENQRSFKAAIEGAKISLGRELFPVFAAWTKALADNGPMLAGYARDLGQKIGPAAQRAATAIKGLAQGFRDGTGTGGEIRSVLSGIGTAVKFLVDHAHGLKLAAEAMLLYAAASKSAAIWNTRLAGANALGAVSGGIAGIARNGTGAADGIAAVGAASQVALPEVLAIASALAGIYEAVKYLKGLDTKDIPNFVNSSGASAYDNSSGYVFDPGTNKYVPDVPVGMDGKPLPPTVAPGKPNVPDDYDQKAGRGKTAVAASKARQDAAATKAASDKADAANKDALAKEQKTAEAAQKVADAKAAAADALQKATDKLRDALQTRLDMAKGIRDSLVQSNSIIREGVSFTAKDLLARFQVTVAKVKRFQTAISELVHKGYSQEIVQQAAQAGIGSLGAVEALAHASRAQVNTIDAAQASLDRAAGNAGERVAGQLGPITFTSNLVVNDKVLATAVNRWNAQHGNNGHLLAS